MSFMNSEGGQALGDSLHLHGKVVGVQRGGKPVPGLPAPGQPGPTSERLREEGRWCSGLRYGLRRSWEEGLIPHPTDGSFPIPPLKAPISPLSALLIHEHPYSDWCLSDAPTCCRFSWPCDALHSSLAHTSHTPSPGFWARQLQFLEILGSWNVGAKPLGVSGRPSEVISSERLNSHLSQKPSLLKGGPRQFARALQGPLPPAPWTSWGRSVQGPAVSHPQPTPRIHLGTAQGAFPTCLCRPPDSENAVLSTQHLRQWLGWQGVGVCKEQVQIHGPALANQQPLGNTGGVESLPVSSFSSFKERVEAS